MEFLSSSSTPWCGGLHESDVGSVVFPNSDELFRRHYSSLVETRRRPSVRRLLLAEMPPAHHRWGQQPGHHRLDHPPESPPHRSPSRPPARSYAMLLA
nr:uncharacterized protein LOC117850873 isoform X2 [Setaria viridis]